MSKIKMKYKTAVMRDADKRIVEDKRRPYIVERRIYNLDELVKFALDNNYIEGAKYELAKGIVKGAIEAERALVLAGNAVSVDGWVKYEPRLKGSVDATKRVLTKDNALAMGISALKEMKLTLDAFAWQCVDEDLKPVPAPTFTKVTAPGHEDDADWANKVGRDGKIVILGTGFTDDLVPVFKTGDTPETFNVTARTATSITGQIAGGLEAGTLSFELQKADGDVIGTAAVEVVE